MDDFIELPDADSGLGDTVFINLKNVTCFYPNPEDQTTTLFRCIDDQLICVDLYYEEVKGYFIKEES